MTISASYTTSWDSIRKTAPAEQKSLASPDALLLAAFGLTETTFSGIAVSQADALRVPVLAVHGEHDSNVPPGESEQFVRAARERGVEAQLLVLRDEGHDFRRADSLRTFRRTAADWIQRHLAD